MPCNSSIISLAQLHANVMFTGIIIGLGFAYILLKAYGCAKLQNLLFFFLYFHSQNLLLPGTLAEREHLKWEKAPPLLNNPYSKENIARRQRQRMYLSRHSSSENSMLVQHL